MCKLWYFPWVFFTPVSLFTLLDQNPTDFFLYFHHFNHFSYFPSAKRFSTPALEIVSEVEGLRGWGNWQIYHFSSFESSHHSSVPYPRWWDIVCRHCIRFDASPPKNMLKHSTAQSILYTVSDRIVETTSSSFLSLPWRSPLLVLSGCIANEKWYIYPDCCDVYKNLYQIYLEHCIIYQKHLWC